MRALDLKLFRDLWRLRAALGAISLVMAAGVAAMIMALSTSASLRRARDLYYEEHRFADVFVQLKRAPDSLEHRLSRVPGVARVQTRVVHEVNLSIPGIAEPGSARLVSIPDTGEPALNGLHLRLGRLPEPGRSGEVVANEAFTQANGLSPGATLGAVINGRWQVLTIVGIGLAPEFVYFVRPGEMLPDNRRSAVLWMSRSDLAKALDMDGAFNDVAVRVSPGASTLEVIEQIDTLLDRYGGLGAHDRTEHVSDRYLRDEFNQLAVMGSLTPAIFLSVGAFLINVVLGRLVRAQREQYATLRAFGYTSGALVRHVLLMAAAISAVACVLGVGAGWLLGADLTGFYTDLYRFPKLLFRLNPSAVSASVLVSMISGGIGAVGAMRWILRLAPAEAMRPEAPREFRATLLERCGVRGLPVRWRMVVRSIESHPWRSGLSALGIAMSAAVLVLSNFALDSIEFMIDREYFASQRYGLLVVFNEATNESAMPSIRGMLTGEGVLRAEPFRAASARVGSEHLSRRVAIVGLPRDSTLHRLLDSGANPVAPAPEGILLSQSLAEVLRVRPGATIDVEFLEGRRRHLEIGVSGVFTGYLGLTAYMDKDALNRAMSDGHLMSGAYVLENPATSQELYRRLKLTPRVAGARGKQGTIDAFRETIAQNITRITLLHASFAAVIAFGVVYNTAKIAFAERQRELATLRVLGFGRAEVARMLLSEIVLLVAVGVPFGLLLGRALAWILVAALKTEAYVFPLVISPATYAFSAGVTILAAFGSAWVVRRGIAQLDLLSTLKNVG